MTVPVPPGSGPDAMSTALFRLVYRSDNAIADAPGSLEAELGRIVHASRRNNLACGVTGALFAGRGCFAQVLEGPLGAVEATFERIGRDWRHGNIMLLDIGPTEQRAFSDWSMTLVQGPDETLPRFTGPAERPVPKAVADRIIELLHAAVAARS